MAFDFKKEYKEFYMPKNRPEIVDVPRANYIAVRGKGNPNEEGGAYQQAVGVLYAVAYTLKMSHRTDHKIEGFFEYVVPPLEGFWWQEKVSGVDYSRKDAFQWISVIRLPDFITRDDFNWAVETASKKKKMDCTRAEFLEVEEGLCVQMMHIGSFDDEPETVAQMDAYLQENGYENDITDTRHHHEIYLSGAGKAEPEKWKTVIRHPIRRIRSRGSQNSKSKLTEEISMDYIRVTKENIDKEHICCAISNNKDIQVSSKKDWMMKCFDDGLVFLKSAERGKCFIEYIPAENAWVPIIAENYMYIDCFWVSGSFKGHGYANDLLNACMKDSKDKGKSGLCILSSAKKKPFLSDPKHLLYKGFKVADVSDAGINLMYFPFGEKAMVPQFTESARHPHIEENGYVLYYTSQCPFNGKYVPLVEQTALENHIPFKAIHIQTKEQAQAVPSPCTSYAMFYNGKFLTNEQFNDKKFLKMVQTYSLF